MDLMHDLAAALPFLRSQAESTFTEKVRAGRVTDATDPVTGDPVQAVTEPFIYEGPARVKYPDTMVSDSASAGQVVASQKVIVKLPVGSVVVPEGAAFMVTASDVDESLVGRTYKVDGSPSAGMVTAHRYPVTELS